MVKKKKKNMNIGYLLTFMHIWPYAYNHESERYNYLNLKLVVLEDSTAGRIFSLHGAEVGFIVAFLMVSPNLSGVILEQSQE